MSGRTNWAGNVTFSASRVHRPSSVDELRRLVAGSPRLRALGTGHSFNPLADCPDGDQVSVAGLPRVLDVDVDARTATVSAGLRYGELVEELQAAGLALSNMGSLPHISVGGACATGTHGSGDRNAALCDAVRALELVTADGEVLELRRDRDADFPGSVVALGCLGVVTRLTLDVVPSYDVAQVVYDEVDRDELLERLPDAFASAYSVSVFTRWDAARRDSVWVKSQVGAGGSVEPPAPEWMGGRLADSARHPIPGLAGAEATEQLGVPGPWHSRLPHFRLEYTPSSGDELQTEYFVRREQAAQALRSLEDLGPRIEPLLLISELRSVAADDLWLGPCSGRHSVGIHFTWKQDDAVLDVLPAIEERLAAYDARPHWGKVFTTAPEVVRGLYPRLDDFVDLAHRMDPGRTFVNPFVERYLGL